MKLQLNRLGLNFQAFNAIDGYDIEITDRKTGKAHAPRTFPQTCTKLNDYIVRYGDYQFEYSSAKCRPLSCGELGCALSHLAIMQDIVRNNYGWAIILEDDLELEPNFKTILNETLEHVPADVDVLFLDIGVINKSPSAYYVNAGELLRNLERVPDDNGYNKYVARLHGTSGYVHGSYAYAISATGAAKILKNSRHVEWPIDNHIMMDSTLVKYVAMKKMLYTSDDTSEIDEMGRK
jgi:glycosyl transferase family 25